MGTQLTPLLKIPVPDWAEKPDVPQWMMNVTAESERHMVLNFATEAARDAAIPTPNRFKGQMCYTADVDIFKYWNGNNWVRANVGKDLSGVAYATYGTDVSIKTSAYYDYTMPITCTRTNGAIVFGRVSLSVTVGDASPNDNSAYLSAWVDAAANIGGWVSRWYSGNSPINCTASADLTFTTRLTLNTGAHTFGLRVSAGSGANPILVNYVQLWAIQVSPTAMAGANGQYGDW